MNERRRDFVLAMGGAAVLLLLDLLPLRACTQQDAWNKAAAETRSLVDAVKAMGGTHPVESKDITITAPDVAEHGAAVPFTIASNVPKTQAIALLIEKNPNMLAAHVSIAEGTEPLVHARVKMAQTSNVYALVKGGDGRVYYAAKEVKVTRAGG